MKGHLVGCLRVVALGLSGRSEVAVWMDSDPVDARQRFRWDGGGVGAGLRFRTDRLVGGNESMIATTKMPPRDS